MINYKQELAISTMCIAIEWIQSFWILKLAPFISLLSVPTASL